MGDATTCRRCSECVGHEHHWIENDRFCEPGDPEFACKHCDAACVAVDDERGFSEPSGIVCAQPAICDGCDWYVRDCECDDGELDDGRDTSSEEDHQCIRDDSTDCDCPSCADAEDRFWAEQGEDAP